MLKSFVITDPIIVQEIINSNKLSYHLISNDDGILKQFADRAGSSKILMIDLQLKPTTLLADMKLVTSDNLILSQVKMEIVPERNTPLTPKTAKLVSTSSKPKKTAYQAFSTDFVPESFDAGQNDTWMFFSPSALINPEYQSVEALFWLKNLAEVDIQITRFRYDVRILEMLQFSVQSYAIMDKVGSISEAPNTDREKGHHSTYLSLKYKIVDESSSPTALALGVRRRMIWDEGNTDFTLGDEDTNEKNDTYNELTLQLMATGRVDNLGLLYNAYLDSMTIGAGVKFLLTSNIKLFADSIFYYHEKPQLSNDFAAGAQLYNPTGSLSLNYHASTRQAQLGFAFDF